MLTFPPQPPSSSPLSAIQGDRAYGDGNPATVTTITYHFGDFFDKSGTSFWTNAYKNEFKQALAVIESVANIQFVETANAFAADLVEYIAPSSFFTGQGFSPNTLGYHYYPHNGPSEGAFNTNWWTAGPGGNGTPGAYFFTTILHEIGHALGLGHPHDTGLSTTVMSGVTSPFNDYGTNNLNQGVYTVMSYNDGWTQVNGNLFSNAQYGGSTGLGALDIAALQALYGANTTHNSGNTVYTLPSANVSGTGYQSIWDTGGIDTIQHLGSTGALIDLRAATIDYSATGGGIVSNVAGVRGGFTIAQGAVIENATGGSGNDTLVGNSAQNVLIGNGGNDTIRSGSDGTNNNSIFGGAGNDTIFVASGTGADTVQGGAGNDLAFVTSNNGSFSGGADTDTVRFASATSGYLFFINGSTLEFKNILTGATFSVATDVEIFQFSNGAQSLNLASLNTVMGVVNIETVGTVLQHANQGIYVLDGGSANVALTYNGQAVGQNTLGGWQAIHTEASGGGYRVLWQNTDGSFAEWTTNSQGQFLSGAAVNNIVSLETVYGVDFNNDNLIGHNSTTVESDGLVNLVASTQNGYVIGGTATVTLNGATVIPGTLGGWAAIQAEASGGGYRILWQNTDGSYAEWTLDGTGAFINGTAIANVIDVESFYGADINGDGTTGHVVTPIESNGSTSLSSSTQGSYLINGSIPVSLNGTTVAPGGLAGWDAVQVEASGGGYRLLWKNSDGSFAEWTLDSAGQFTGGAAVGNVVDLEIFYGADINGDGTTGHTINSIETAGSTDLGASTQGMYMINGTIAVTLNGANIGPGSLSGWSAIHVEASGGGYRLLWKNTDGSYAEWTLDGSGQYTGGAAVPDVVAVEAFYQWDIDGSGTVGFAQPKLAHPDALEPVANQLVADLLLAVDEEDTDNLIFVAELEYAEETEPFFETDGELAARNISEIQPEDSDGLDHHSEDELEVFDPLEEDAFLI